MGTGKAHAGTEAASGKALRLVAAALLDAFVPDAKSS